MPAPFNPDEDHAVVRGNPERAYIQNGWYYDADGNALERHNFVPPSPEFLAQRALEAKLRKMRRSSSEERGIPRHVRMARKENAAALAAEALAE